MVYYDYEQEYYEEPDYEQFERKMLDLDREVGEFDFDEEPYEYVDSEQNTEGSEEAEEV